MTEGVAVSTSYLTVHLANVILMGKPHVVMVRGMGIAVEACRIVGVLVAQTIESLENQRYQKTTVLLLE